MNKRLFLLLLVTIYTADLYAECGFKNSNNVWEAIKTSHPSVLLNNLREEVLKRSMDIASQVPNPELDVDILGGRTTEGNVATASVSVKYILELGEKRVSRENLAKNSIKLGKTIFKDLNERSLIASVMKLYRLRQVYDLIELYDEASEAFSKILKVMKSKSALSPEQRVEKETLVLATSDYKLKIAQLENEKINLQRHLSFYTGKNCKISESNLPKNIDFNQLEVDVDEIENFAKFQTAKKELAFAKTELELEKSNSYPNVSIGPSYEYERVNITTNNLYGVALTMDLPILNTNSGGRAKAAEKVIAASKNLKNIETESRLDLELWVNKYNAFRLALKNITSRNELEKKHQRVEALFKRGIISTAMVIESHRQLIEFSISRLEFERGAMEALWNIYRFNEDITKKTIL